MTGPNDFKDQDPSLRVAALDLGSVRVGLAVSDELGLLAHPRPALDGTDSKRLLAKLAELAAREPIGRFLVGLPLSLSGEPTTSARRAIRFCQKLADATGCEVELIDERLTSVQAERELLGGGADRREVKAKVDGVAAALILQQWLDAQRTAETED
jgi:putative Holliday junction resolvase